MLNRKYSMLNLFVICVEIESEWVAVGWRTIIIGQDWLKSKFGVFRCNRYHDNGRRKRDDETSK